MAFIDIRSQITYERVFQRHDTEPHVYKMQVGSDYSKCRAASLATRQPTSFLRKNVTSQILRKTDSKYLQKMTRKIYGHHSSSRAMQTNWFYFYIHLTEILKKNCTMQPNATHEQLNENHQTLCPIFSIQMTAFLG